MTNSTQTKFQEYTQYLLDAFTTNTRSQDCVDRGMNKVYYSIKDDHPDKDQIQTDLIYPLHDDELPNDWRYETIYDLLSGFLEYEDRQDIEDHVHEIVDGAVDVYNYDLAKWLCDDVSRGYFDQSLDNAEFISDDTSIYGIITKRQYEVISEMAYQLLDYIDNNAEEEE